MPGLLEIDAITVDLQSKELDALKFFVEKTKECGSQHLSWEKKDTGEQLQLKSCPELTFKYSEFIKHHASLEALASLGFASFRITGDSPESVVRIQPHYHITLFPAAYHRYEHEKKNKVVKWWRITLLRHKDWMGVVAFLISVILSLYEIYKIFNPPPGP